MDASCPGSPLEEESFATTVTVRRDADASDDADSWEKHEWEFTLSEASRRERESPLVSAGVVNS